MGATTSYLVGVKFTGDGAQLARAAQEARKQMQAMGATSITEAQRMATARQTLGVRSEREIQREIQRTEAAYNRLARSGTMSMAEQARAARAARAEIEKLTNEMGRLTTRQKAVGGLKLIAGAGAAVGVAGAIAAPTVRKAMDYDISLSHLANTAFNERSMGGRMAGRQELDALIKDAVRYGGGTREGGVATAETLLGAGVFKPGDLKAILRDAVMAGTANNADPQAFAQMAISAYQTMGIKPENMGKAFGIATYAGQSGGFEVRDMAKWMSQQMAAAKAVGMYGEQGFAKLAALNQAAVVTAGTKDEAGNNVVNLLAKLGSPDTAKDFKKLGINLPKQLAEGRMKGLDALDVTANILAEQLGKDLNYQSVQKQLAAAKTDSERRAALSAVGDIAQGTTIGKVFQDRQALLALYGFLNARSRVDEIQKNALANPDAAAQNMELIRTTASFKAQQMGNEKDMAMQQAMDKLLPTVGGVADELTKLMREYPGYTVAIMGATTGLTALAGAAGMAALASGGGSGVVGAMLGRAGAVALPVAQVLGAGAVGYGIGTVAYKGALEGNQGGDVVGELVARVMGAMGNTEAQQALAINDALRNSKVGGEITVRVQAAPGMTASADLRPLRDTTMRADRLGSGTFGMTNQNAGY